MLTSLFNGRSAWYSAGRQLVFGCLAAGVTYGVGAALGALPLAQVAESDLNADLALQRPQCLVLGGQAAGLRLPRGWSDLWSRSGARSASTRSGAEVRSEC